MPDVETRIDNEGRGQRLALLLLGLLGLATLGFLVWRESTADRVFRRHQQRYHELVGKGAPEHAGVRRVVSPDGEDRCPTCHMGIPGEGAERADLPNPYRPHAPALLQQHPPGRFLCTSCHGAGGTHVDRCLPSRGDRDARALGRELAQASCLGCHAGERAWNLPGGERLTAGLRAYRRLGCGGCHRGGALLPEDRRIGPPLDRAWSKLTPTFMRNFLADPQRLRPGTAMPSFFSTDAVQGAPRASRSRVGGQAKKRITALVSYLRRENRSWSPAPGGGDAARGARLLRERGCIACHVTEPDNEKLRRAGLGGVGPDLTAAGSRLSPAWLAAWLRRPAGYNNETAMPDLRLAEQDVLDLVQHLAGKGGPARPPTGPRPAATGVESGRGLARDLGCAGCHRLQELEQVQPVGPDLDGYGDKREALLDWGSVRPGARRSWQRWTELKLTRPLAFDRASSPLLMPWQKLRPGELSGLIVLMRGLVNAPPPGPRPSPGATPDREQRRRDGETLVQDLGCRQCHQVAGRGAAVRAVWPRPSDRAPSLDGQGAKVLPGWAYRFLRGPTDLRPWLGLRMPSFSRLDDHGARVLSAYFAALDRASYPFVMQRSDVPQGMRLKQAFVLFEQLQCVRCHLVSNAPSLQPGELAPDLGLSGERLRRAWIERFLLEPQKVMPGTRMPTLFPLADEDDPGSRLTPAPALFDGKVTDQIRALTDLNLAWDTLGRQAPASGR